MPAVSAKDRQVIVDLAQRAAIIKKLRSSPSRCMVDDVKRAADLSGIKGCVIEIPCNEEMITQGIRLD